MSLTKKLVAEFMGTFWLAWFINDKWLEQEEIGDHEQ
jgi:glycerol uptake facilitator-like aquaporin